MSARQSITVHIRGRDFRVRTDGDEESLQRVAGYLDETMEKIERRTGTVDSLDVALLTALNLAREVVELRDEDRTASPGQIGRLRSLIDLAESALPPEAG